MVAVPLGKKRTFPDSDCVYNPPLVGFPMGTRTRHHVVPSPVGRGDEGRGQVTLLQRLRHDLLSAKFPRALLAACTVTAVLVLYCFAISGIIFNGPLHPFAAEGAGMLLFGAAVFCLVVGLSSGYGGALAAPQDASAVVLGTMAATVAAGTDHAPATTAFMTMTALLIVSSLVTGLSFVAIGHFRLSNLLRFIPFPVTAGFIAGVGWTLSVAAVALMSGMALDWETLPRFLDAERLWKWGPGVAYGLVLFVAMRRTNSIAVLFGSLVAFTLLFHLVLFVLGLSVEDAKAAGLMLSGRSQDGLWPTFGPSDFAHVNWEVVVDLLPEVFAVVMITLLYLLVCIHGLELSTGVKVDLDREFRAAGFAGMIAGMGGSGPGGHTIVLSYASWKLGADTPWTGLLTFLGLGLTLYVGGTTLDLVPMSVIGGFLFFLGVDLLHDWLIAIRRRLDWMVYGVVVLITLSIAFVGFVEGIVVGLFVAFVLFAVRMSQMELVEASLTGRDLRSHKVRPVPHEAILNERGERIRIFRLRGYVFFGSIHRLTDRLEQPLGESPPPSFIVLDCAAVLGFDYSSTRVLCLYLLNACSHGVKLVICTAPSGFRLAMTRDLPTGAEGNLRFESDLDRAVEWCEDASIVAYSSDETNTAESRGALLERVAPELEEHLDRQVVFEELLDRLEPWLERRQYDVGDWLGTPGRPETAIHLLVAGRASVVDTGGKRLFQCGVGDAIGHRGVFRAHRAMAAVVADEPCVTMVLGARNQRLLEATEPELSLKFYRYLITDGGCDLPVLTPRALPSSLRDTY